MSLATSPCLVGSGKCVTALATAERPPHCAFQHLDVGVGVGLPILGASSGQLAARVMPEQGLMGYHHIISRLVFDPVGLACIRVVCG